MLIIIACIGTEQYQTLKWGMHLQHWLKNKRWSLAFWWNDVFNYSTKVDEIDQQLLLSDDQIQCMHVYIQRGTSGRNEIKNIPSRKHRGTWGAALQGRRSCPWHNAPSSFGTQSPPHSCKTCGRNYTARDLNEPPPRSSTTSRPSSSTMRRPATAPPANSAFRQPLWWSMNRSIHPKSTTPRWGGPTWEWTTLLNWCCK